MVLGNIPVRGRPTYLDNSRQGPSALVIGVSGGCLDSFTLIYHFYLLSFSLRNGPLYTEILSQRPLKAKTTNQHSKYKL